MTYFKNSPLKWKVKLLTAAQSFKYILSYFLKYFTLSSITKELFLQCLEDDLILSYVVSRQLPPGQWPSRWFLTVQIAPWMIAPEQLPQR